MIPTPVEAIIFLFPITEAYEKFKDEEEAHLTKCEQSISPNVVFFKQTIANACGMIALLHSVASNDQNIVGKKKITSKYIDT
jgi:ubiquitin carboxyl-terminal hydrolase L3